MKVKKLISLVLCLFLVCICKVDVFAKDTSKQFDKTNVPNYISAPMGVTVTAKENGAISIYWKKVTGASYYYVYYSSKLNGTYYKSSKITGTATYFKNAKSGSTYYFKVKAYSNDAVSNYSRTVSITINDAPDAPENADAEYNDENQQIEIQWDEVEDVDGYYIYYSQDKDGSYKCANSDGIPQLFKSTKASWKGNFNDGDTYYIFVTAVKDGMESDESNIATVTIGGDKEDSDAEYFPDLPDVPVIPNKDYDTSYSSDGSLVSYSYSGLTSSDISDYKELLNDNGWEYNKTTKVSGYTVYEYTNGDETVYIAYVGGKFMIMGFI